MNFLNLEGLKLVLSSLLSKISVAFDALEARVTSAESNKVNKSGDTMTGSLDMGNNEVKNVKELKGNKITTTSISETNPNVKVESLKVRDDRVDILKTTMTADDGSTSASSAAYFKNGYMEVNGDFKAKGNINTADGINADGGVLASGNIETTNGSVKASDGVDLTAAYASFDIYEDYYNSNKKLKASYSSTGFTTKISGNDIYFGVVNSANKLLGGLVLEHSSSGIKVRLDARDNNGNLKKQLVLDPDSGGPSGFKTGDGFNIMTDDGGVVMQFGNNGGGFKLRVSSTCNFTGNVTNNEFAMVGNYRFKDVADHVTVLPSDTTDEEKAWLENYLHNLFLDLKRNKLDEADAATEDELNALLVNSYDGSESQLNMLVASSGGLAEVVNVGDDANIYICNNGDAYLAGSGETNDYGCGSSPLKNKNIDSIYILDGITSIGEEFFCSLTSLTQVYMSDSVTYLSAYAFDYCENLTTIGASCFYSCESITSMVIPDSVTSLGESAFESLTNLTSITIPNSIVSIPSGAFYDCLSLTEITIPNSVESIESNAFNGTSLTEITIPGSVTSIGYNAFINCTNLTSITINKPQDSITGQPWGATSAEIIWTGGE